MLPNMLRSSLALKARSTPALLKARSTRPLIVNTSAMLMAPPTTTRTVSAAMVALWKPPSTSPVSEMFSVRTVCADDVVFISKANSPVMVSPQLLKPPASCRAPTTPSELMISVPLAAKLPRGARVIMPLTSSRNWLPLSSTRRAVCM